MREQFNLTHIINTAGHIGRLQTLANIPILPGDSIEIDFDSIIRLAPPSMDIITECQVDVCGFFSPLRHHYPDQYLQWVAAGPDATALTSDTISIPATTTEEGRFNRAPSYLLINECGDALPRHIVQGYNHIFQRYYAVKNTPNNGQDTQDFFSTLSYYPEDDPNYLQFGKLAARLPHIMNGGTILEGPGAIADIDLDDSDATVTGTIDTGVDESYFDVRDLNSIKARYEAEIEQAWFNNSYADLFEAKFGTFINTDADQRPEYLFRETRFLSGADVDGTDDATHGSFVSKLVDRLQFRMPRKAFMEHGNLWIMALFRFPLIHTDEIHPLYKTRVGPEYINDFKYAAAQPPIPFNPENKWLTSTSTWVPSLDTREPPFQHYRYMNNYTHPLFKRTPGFPFTDWRNTSGDLQWYYYNDNEYRRAFKSSQFAQWRVHGRAAVKRFSLLNGVGANIFAGAR